MWLSKRALLAGIAIGFLACCGLGRLASRQPMFEHFERFFAPIQPQRYFYPTASELVSYLEHQFVPGKRLALVGGASFLRGVGQNPSELWSLELARRLKDRYTVVNFAIESAGISSFSAIPYQILALRHPDMIYITNGSQLGGEARDGEKQYQYVFWDAYYKGLFPPAVAGAESVRAARAAELRTAEGLEMHLGKMIDAWTYSCDLWTYVGYKWLFTVWSDYHAASPFKARREYHEDIDPDIAQSRRRNEADAKLIDLAEAGNRWIAQNGYTQLPDGRWQADPGVWKVRQDNWRSLFPAELRERCFVILLRSNPYYMKTLTPDDLAHYEQSYGECRHSLEQVGYPVVTFPAGEFSASDFLDPGHFLAAGGYKIAAATAARIAEVDRSEAATADWDRGPRGPAEFTLKIPPRIPPSGLELLRVDCGSGVQERVGVEAAAADRIRFSYREAAGESPIYSAAVPARPGEIHQVTVSTSGLYPPGGDRSRWKEWLALDYDRRPVWSVPVDARDRPLGKANFGAGPAILAAARASKPPPDDQPWKISGALVRLTGTLPVLGRMLPLAATGHRGAGDLLFVRWSDKGALSFGYDHWNDATVYSPELALPANSAHEVEFQLPALTGKPDLTVKVDGRAFWTKSVGFYPAAATEVYWGQNPIGATTAEKSLESGRFERLLMPESDSQ